MTAVAKRIPRKRARKSAVVDIRREYADGRVSKKEITDRNVAAVRATIFGLAKAKGAPEPDPEARGSSSGKSKALEPDPFMQLERSGRVVPPPFDPLTLQMLPENSTELAPAIEAMSVNCEWFGWKAEPRVRVDDKTSLDVLRTVVRERTEAENFFENAFQDEDSIEEFRDKLRRDLETVGSFYVEFVEVPGSGKLDGLNHLPAWTVRITRPDDEPTEYVDLQLVKNVRVVVPEGEVDPAFEGVEFRKSLAVEEVSYELKETIRFKRFRRYVQIRDRQTVWFKELGDPRLISCKTGKVVTREELLKIHDTGSETMRFTLADGDRIVIRKGLVGFPIADAANPLRQKRLYSGRSPYGMIRYVGHFFAIFGSRASEEINYTTFKNNNIPSLAVTVSNGQLTDESVDRIEEFVEAQIQSDDNYSKFLLLEAEPNMEGMRDPGSMKIEIKPLTREQHTDALFVQYQEANDERIRRAWRFPPIFVGKSTDFTAKTIEASRKLADEQVFGVERKRMDDFFTKDVLMRYLLLAWTTFRSNSPNVTENADLLRALVNGEKTGSVTPQIGRDVLSAVLNRDLGRVDPTLLNPYQPFSLTLAQLMKSDSASAAPGGGEPNSQGSSGLQNPGDGDRDRESEPAGVPDSVDKLAELLRAEVSTRFGGFVPLAFEVDGEDDE